MIDDDEIKDSPSEESTEPVVEEEEQVEKKEEPSVVEEEPVEELSQDEETQEAREGEEPFALEGEEEIVVELIPDDILISRIESLIFVSPEPITVRRLARILSVEGKRVRELLEKLTEFYEERGINVQEISGGFQFRSHPDNAPVIREVFKLKPLKISRPALETLAIVAYRQPLTRGEAEAIRGVDCGGVLKFLFEKELVRVIGRKEEPGRPIIYGTSQKFLELFGLKSLADLPPLHEFTELWEDHQQQVDEETPLEETNKQENHEATEEPAIDAQPGDNDEKFSDTDDESSRRDEEPAVQEDEEEEMEIKDPDDQWTNNEIEDLPDEDLFADIEPESEDNE